MANNHIVMEHSTDEGRTWTQIEVKANSPIVRAPHTYFTSNVNGVVVLADGVGNLYRKVK